MTKTNFVGNNQFAFEFSITLLCISLMFCLYIAFKLDVSDETTEPREGELIPEVIDTKTSIELTADSLPEFQTRIISRPRRCNSNPITDMNCCTGGRPCGIGQGDCDYDSDCQYGLKCGTDNCYYDFPTTYGFNWEIMADCCYGMYIF